MVVVTLNDQPYMELEFNYDSQSVQTTREYDFTSSSSSSSTPEESSGTDDGESSGSDGEDSSSQENAQ